MDALQPIQLFLGQMMKQLPPCLQDERDCMATCFMVVSAASEGPSKVLQACSDIMNACNEPAPSDSKHLLLSLGSLSQGKKLVTLAQCLAEDRKKNMGFLDALSQQFDLMVVAVAAKESSDPERDIPMLVDKIFAAISCLSLDVACD